jgi:hypothetical protein
MGAGLLAVKSGFILFIKNYQFPLQINTLERVALADFGCRWFSQLWRVTDPRPDLENFCGHDTEGICVLIGEV